MPIDSVDLKVLHALDENSRQSASEIARKTKLSEDVVRYRLQELERSGVVLKFHTAIDTAKLGLSMFEILFKVHMADERRINEMISFLSAENCVTWVARLDGIYDIGIALRVEKTIVLSEFLDRFLHRFNENISKRTLQLNIDCGYLRRDYLVGRKRGGKFLPHFQSTSEPAAIDEIDRAILKLLGTHSRYTAAGIARELDKQQLRAVPLSREAVLLRIKKLERQKFITGYTIALNHASLDQLHYKVLLYFNHIEVGEIEAFLEGCRSHPRVVYLIKALGEWDYELDIEVKNVNEYRQVMSDLLTPHPHAVRDYSSVIIAKIFKYTTACAY